MVPLGHLAKGATLEDLLETCIHSFGECLEVFSHINLFLSWLCLNPLVGNKLIYWWSRKVLTENCMCYR